MQDSEVTPPVKFLANETPLLVIHTYIHTLLLPPQRGFSGTIIIEEHYIIYIN